MAPGADAVGWDCEAGVAADAGAVGTVVVADDISGHAFHKSQCQNHRSISRLSGPVSCCRFNGHRPKLFELSRTLSD